MKEELIDMIMWEVEKAIDEETEWDGILFGKEVVNNNKAYIKSRDNIWRKEFKVALERIISYLD